MVYMPPSHMRDLIGPSPSKPPKKKESYPIPSKRQCLFLLLFSISRHTSPHFFSISQLLHISLLHLASKLPSIFHLLFTLSNFLSCSLVVKLSWMAARRIWTQWPLFGSSLLWYGSTSFILHFFWVLYFKFSDLLHFQYTFPSLIFLFLFSDDFLMGF